MKKHSIWMIIGCTVPLLLIFFAPVLGLSNSWYLFIFIIAMFACHLLMPMFHGGHGAHENKDRHHEEKKQTLGIKDNK